jgi:hypothetical protein
MPQNNEMEARQGYNGASLLIVRRDGMKGRCSNRPTCLLHKR